MTNRLKELHDAGVISKEEAYSRSEQKTLMRQHLAK